MRRATGLAAMYRRQAAIPILALGDSYTYGEEVNNGETCSSILAALTGRKVLNAEVAGYGFDQIVLRAGLLAPTVHPSAVVVSFIADDLRRTGSQPPVERRQALFRDRQWRAGAARRAGAACDRSRAHARRAAVGLRAFLISWISCCAGSS